MWAYAQFGHTPAPTLMAAVLAQTEAQVAALQVSGNLGQEGEREEREGGGADSKEQGLNGAKGPAGRKPQADGE
jgi:hypothetical protein